MLNIYLILIKKRKNLLREREREIINNRYIIYCKLFLIFYLILSDTHYREDARAISVSYNKLIRIDLHG